MVFGLFRNGKEGNIGPLDQRHLPGFLQGKFGNDHIVVEIVRFRLPDRAQDLHIFSHDFLRTGKGPHYSRGCSGFRTCQVDLRVRIARPAPEVAVGGPDRCAFCGRSLADGAAGAAGDLQEPDPGVQKHVDIAVL